MNTYTDTTHLYLQHTRLRETDERVEQLRHLDALRAAATAPQGQALVHWFHQLRPVRRPRPLRADGRRFGVAR